MNSFAIISRRYAKGLLSVLDDNDLDLVEQQIGDLVAQKKSNLDFNRLLENPSFSFLEREKVIKKLGQVYKFNSNLENFLCLLISKNRINLISQINSFFVALIDERRGRIRAIVKSATPLKSSMLAELENIITQKYKQKILLQTRVDPKLLAGIRIEIDQEVYDGTLKAKLDGIRTQLRYVHG